MSWRYKLNDFLLALLVLVFTDVVLFHYGAYFPFLQPKSFSGGVEQTAQRFAGIQETFPDRDGIVVMGNSRTKASVRESQLEAELAAGGLRYRVSNLSVGGSSPRAWYFLLESDWIARDTTKIVVLGVNNNSIQIFKRVGRPDLDISKTRLGIRDAATIASSYRGFENQLAVFSGALFRTLLFRDDVKQYLLSPSDRHRQLTDSRKLFEKQMRADARVDNSSARNLATVRLGEDNRLVADELAPFLQENKKLSRRIERLMRRQQRVMKAMARGKKTVKRLRLEPGKMKLLKRLVEELNDDGIKVVLCVTPNSPFGLNRPVDVDHLGDFFRDLERRGANVEVWHDREMVRELDTLEYHKDSLHMNAAGAEIYTSGLARFLIETLATPDAELELEVQERLDAVRSEQDHRPYGDHQDHDT